MTNKEGLHGAQGGHFMSTIARNQIANSAHNSSLEYAHLYLADAYCPVPIKPRSKMPCDSGWQKLRLTEEQLPDHFVPGTNVGVVLGEPSSGLVDVDLDNANALKLAPYFLPETDFIFGRHSKPASHWLYQTQNPGRIKKLAARETIIEVRAPAVKPYSPDRFTKAAKPLNSAALSRLYRYRPRRRERLLMQRRPRSLLHRC